MRNARPSKVRKVRPAERIQSDHPSCRGGETYGPRADPGPLEEAVDEREDSPAHKTLSGMAD